MWKPAKVSQGGRDVYKNGSSIAWVKYIIAGAPPPRLPEKDPDDPSKVPKYGYTKRSL